MFNERRPSFESTPDETTTIANDFEQLFRTQRDSVLEEEFANQSNSFSDSKMPEEGLSERKDEESCIVGEFSRKAEDEADDGNCERERRVNNQVSPRAVNRISKEMKKCSKEYFRRAYAKEKKNVMFVAKQVSFCQTTLHIWWNSSG